MILQSSSYIYETQKTHGPEELRKKKKQKSKSNYLIIISFLKKSKYLVFNLIFSSLIAAV